jgi:hypothetical protein
MRAVGRTLTLGFVTAIAAVAMAVSPLSLEAFPAGGGSETSDGSAPAGGAEVTNTDKLPVSATQGSIAVQPLAGDDLASFNEMIGAVVDTFPNTGKLSKRGQATLGCVLMSYLYLANRPADHAYTFTDLNIQAAMLDVCLQLARSLPAPARDPAGTARAGCGRIDAALRIQITHSRSGYRVTTVGLSNRVPRPSLNITCRHTGKGVLIGVLPAKPGQTLARAGAPELGIAYDNPSKTRLGIRTTFTAN